MPFDRDPALEDFARREAERVEMSNARAYLSDRNIRVGDAVTFGDSGDRFSGSYLGLMVTEHGVVAVVRVLNDLLMPTHYSNLTKV